MHPSAFRRRLATMATRLQTAVTAPRIEALVVVAGMAFVAAAAFEVHYALGLATVGASLIAAGVNVGRR